MWGALVLSLLVATFSIVDAQTGSFHELIRNKTREVIQDIQNANQLLSLSTLNITPKQLYFNQTVDHFGSQQGINGTWFNQFFLLVDDFYKVGGPVILYIEGEGELKDSSVTSDSLVRQVAQQYNGLLIGLEHRFYGTPDTGRSIPTFDFSNESAHSSSAPVIPESNFWRYSYAVEEGMNHFSGSPICMQGWTRA
ncbi:serine carboxypeptidase S28-domain-containing protein, partial [Obelidium mucronatum]